MFWPLMLYIALILVFLIYIFSKIILQNRIIRLLEVIPNEGAETAKRKMRTKWLNRINVFSLLLLSGLICWAMINGAKDSLDFERSLTRSQKARNKVELNDALYTKPSRGMYSSSPSLWVFLKYPQKGMESYEKLSEGPGEITGRILLDGKPLAGFSVSLILNDGNKGLDCLKTDAHGYYKALIPYGKYEFNAMTLTGEEVRNKISPQNEMRWQGHSSQKNAQVFELNDRNRSFQIMAIELVDPIKHITPNSSVIDLAKATKGTKIFEWSPFAEARSYGVEVSRVVKETKDSGEEKTYYSDEKSLPFRTNDTFITLEQFEQLLTVYEPGVYGIRIFAYGNGNRILSYSFDFQEIALTDGKAETIVSKK